MNDQAKNFFYGSSSGTTPQPDPPNLLLQSNSQTQSGVYHFPGHFQFLISQAQYAHALAQAQAQAEVHAQLLAQVEAARIQSQPQIYPADSVLHNRLASYALALPNAHALAQAQTQAEVHAQLLSQVEVARAQLQPQTYPADSILHNKHASYANALPNAQAEAQLLSQAEAADAYLQPQTHRADSILHNNNVINIDNVDNKASPPTVIGSAKRATQRPAHQKKKDMPQKQMLEKPISVLPESQPFTKCLDLQNRMETELAQRKFDLQEALKSAPHVKKTLRVYVFNTFSNQANFDKKNDEEASWSLKIIGRILEDDMDSEVAGTSKGLKSPSYPKFSAFFKRVAIYLDQNLYPNDHLIVWDNARSPIQQDGFEVKRKGDKEFTAKIIMEMKNVPEKFMLSPQLSKLLGIEVETYPRIIAALWHYVRSQKLEIRNDPFYFMCDPSLQMIFGVKEMKFEDAAKELRVHLSQMQPIHLDHQIKLSGNSAAETTCYDIQVYMHRSLDKDISSIWEHRQCQKEIEFFEGLINVNIKKIHEHQRRRAFFLSFSNAPEEFINASITSQSKDLKLVGDETNIPKKERLSEFYNQPWVEDAMIAYLNHNNQEEPMSADAPKRKGFASGALTPKNKIKK